MNNTISLLQIAWKAGKVVFGDRLIPAIQKNEVFLVIMSSSCGNNRKKKLKDKCVFYQIPLMEIDALRFNSISSRSMNSFGITDKHFVEAIEKKG